MPLFLVVFNKTITAEVDNTNAVLTHSTRVESEKRHHKAQFFPPFSFFWQSFTLFSAPV